MADTYPTITDDEAFDLDDGQDLILACCDCGLIHHFSFHKTQTGLEVTATRDDRRTAQRRRRGLPGLMNGEDAKWKLVRR